MLHLENILHSQGFSITIIHTNFNSPDPSKYPHFTFHFLEENLTESESSTADVLAFVSLLNAKSIDPFRDCLSRLLSDGDEPVACLISDAIFHFTQDVANSFKIPRIVLRTGDASSFLVFASFPFLKAKCYLPIQESQLEEQVKEFPPLKVKDIPVINTCHQEELYQLVLSMVNQTRASSGLILNTFEDLEQPALASLLDEFPIPIFPVGPFHKCPHPTSSSLLSPHGQSCISWLDRQAPKSVLYISFGSIAAISETEFLEIAWGLANSKQPYLWVVRPGLVRSTQRLELLPKELLEEWNDRGQIVKWAPQLQVLAHQAVGAFWTHNGWNC